MDLNKKSLSKVKTITAWKGLPYRIDKFNYYFFENIFKLIVHTVSEDEFKQKVIIQGKDYHSMKGSTL